MNLIINPIRKCNVRIKLEKENPYRNIPLRRLLSRLERKKIKQWNGLVN